MSCKKCREEGPPPPLTEEQRGGLISEYGVEAFDEYVRHQRGMCADIPSCPQCPNCGMGVDTDGDGDCVVCAPGKLRIRKRENP